MISFGTEHLTLDKFKASYEVAEPGDQITYALGDIGASRAYSPALNIVAATAWNLAKQGHLRLTQRATYEIFRNGGGRCFEYIATKCHPKISAPTQSPRSSSRGGVLAKA